MVVCLSLAIASALSLISLALLTILVVLVLPLLTRALICTVTAHAACALSIFVKARPCPWVAFILWVASCARLLIDGVCAVVK